MNEQRNKVKSDAVFELPVVADSSRVEQRVDDVGGSGTKPMESASGISNNFRGYFYSFVLCLLSNAVSFGLYFALRDHGDDIVRWSLVYYGNIDYVIRLGLKNLLYVLHCYPVSGVPGEGWTPEEYHDCVAIRNGMPILLSKVVEIVGWTFLAANTVRMVLPLVWAFGRIFVYFCGKINDLRKYTVTRLYAFWLVTFEVKDIIPVEGDNIVDSTTEWNKGKPVLRTDTGVLVKIPEFLFGNILRTTHDVQNEAAMPMSVFREAKPKQCIVRFFVRGSLVGSGWRYKNAIVTADHVWRNLENKFEVSGVTPKTLTLVKHQTAIPLDYNPVFDWMIFSVDPAVFSALAITTAKVAFPIAGEHTDVFRCLEGTWQCASGSITTDPSTNLSYCHNVSTNAGLSGSPMFQKDFVVLTHLFHNPTVGKNVGVLIPHILPNWDKLRKGQNLESSFSDYREKIDERLPEFARELREKMKEIRDSELARYERENTQVTAQELADIEYKQRKLSGKFKSKSGLNWADMFDEDVDQYEESGESPFPNFSDVQVVKKKGTENITSPVSNQTPNSQGEGTQSGASAPLLPNSSNGSEQPKGSKARKKKKSPKTLAVGAPSTQVSPDTTTPKVEAQ